MLFVETVEDIGLGLGHLAEVVEGAAMLLLVGGIGIAHVAERLQPAVLAFGMGREVSHGFRELAPGLLYRDFLQIV